MGDKGASPLPAELIGIVKAVALTRRRLKKKVGVFMESAVFLYFFCIGAGLALGVATVALPALMLTKKINNKGVSGNAKQTKQRASI